MFLYKMDSGIIAIVGRDVKTATAGSTEFCNPDTAPTANSVVEPRRAVFEKLKPNPLVAIDLPAFAGWIFICESEIILFLLRIRVFIFAGHFENTVFSLVKDVLIPNLP